MISHYKTLQKWSEWLYNYNYKFSEDFHGLWSKSSDSEVKMIFDSEINWFWYFKKVWPEPAWNIPIWPNNYVFRSTFTAQFLSGLSSLVILKDFVFSSLASPGSIILRSDRFHLILDTTHDSHFEKLDLITKGELNELKKFGKHSVFRGGRRGGDVLIRFRFRQIHN